MVQTVFTSRDQHAAFFGEASALTYADGVAAGQALPLGSSVLRTIHSDSGLDGFASDACRVERRRRARRCWIASVRHVSGYAVALAYG